MNKVLGMLGLAIRAGKVVSGEFKSLQAVKNGQSQLVIMASDISDNGRKSIVNACRFYGVEYIELGMSQELGKAIGEETRMIVSVNDDSFKNAILSKIERIDEQYGR